MKIYRVWYIINIPGEPIYHYVGSPKEGFEWTNIEADRQLQDASIISNVFGFEQNIDGEWQEWEDEKGNGLDEHFGFEEANITTI